MYRTSDLLEVAWLQAKGYSPRQAGWVGPLAEFEIADPTGNLKRDLESEEFRLIVRVVRSWVLLRRELAKERDRQVGR